MNKICTFATIVMTLGILIGCAGNRDLFKTVSTSTRQDVFQEIAHGAALVSGYADLRVYSSLKTHKPGIYSAKDIHGTADYKIIMNIDGQTVELLGDLQRENSEARALNDPEAGEGMRYHFSKNIRIKVGTHKIVIAIPADDLAIEREITLTAGSSNTLAFEPVYGNLPGKQRPGFYRDTSFTEGLKLFRVVLNGKYL